MKENYIKSLLIFGLLFLSGTSFSQHLIQDSDFGSAVQSYLDNKKVELNLTDNDINDLFVNKEYFSKSTEVNHVYINQRFQGIKIHNAISSFAIRGNEVFYVANRFKSNLSTKINTITPEISSLDAIQRALAYFNLVSTQNFDVLNVDNNEFVYFNATVSKDKIPVELVYTEAIDGTLKLSWDLSIHTLDGKHWWSVRVDAKNGEIIETDDWIVSCNFGEINHSKNHIFNHNKEESSFNLFKTNNSLLVDGSQYNVVPLPVESPNHGSRQLITEPANLSASPFGWHDTDGAAGEEFTITQGNNVLAQEDRDGNDDTGYSPSGITPLNFDFPYDPNQEAIGYQDAAITNLFYMNNMMHDIWYSYGFDEVSGNFQANNYGNGGAENDFVIADAQDGSGLNNANFGTPPDGGNPRMQMFMWNGAPIANNLTINNGALAGDYAAAALATFGAVLTPTPITADLVLVVDSNTGVSTDPNDACDNITNFFELTNKIAVIRRGECEFGFKVKAAEDLNAIAVIIVNNEPGATSIAMGPGAVGDAVTIPSIMVSQTEGEAIIAALEGGDTISASLIGPYQIDGNFDNGVVAHEYGHGISNRLTGGPGAAGCLGNMEQMGEGWSDWFGLMVTIEPGDLGTDGRGIGTFDNAEDVNGTGIRPAKYSTDLGINGFTYSDIDSVSIPHGVGFVWSTMLWDLTWAYIDKYGFEPNLYSGKGGNNKVMQIVLDGLKLQPCSPGFVDGRDAILAADMALTGGKDQCMIWEVFAARGLGVGAMQNSTESVTDQVENFDMPLSSDPSLANCTTLSVDDFKSNGFNVYPNPTKNLVSIEANKYFGEVIITLSDINGRQVITDKVDLINKVDINMSHLQTGLYILNIKGETINVNKKIIKN